MTKLQAGRHASTIKEVKKASKKCKMNTYIKSKLKTSIKTFERLIQKGNKNVLLIKKQLSATFSQLDKASNKNVIHHNKAANQKKRLTSLFTTTLKSTNKDHK
jgi:small subunit ribosomal protein S20